MTGTPVGNGGYRPDVDGLRAVAVIAVILNHFDERLLPSGYLGVDIFFVISGFVITASLAARSKGSLTDFIGSFYARRVKRIVPALVFAVVGSSLLVSMFNPQPRLSLVTGLLSLAGVSNLYLYRESLDYFAGSTIRNAFTHTWSLGVEEQFYLVFPLLLWFAGLYDPRRSRRVRLIVIILLLAIASLVAFFGAYETDTNAAFYLMPFRFWELGAGCLLFLAGREGWPGERFAKAIPTSMVAAALLALLMTPARSGPVWTLAAVASTGLIIQSAPYSRLVRRVLESPPVVYVGKISYSLYLWHWTLLSVGYFTVGIGIRAMPFLLPPMFGLSMLSYHLVEVPLRRRAWGRQSWQSVSVGLGASAAAMVLLAALVAGGAHSAYLGRMPEDLPNWRLLVPYGPEGATGSWAARPCVLTSAEDVGKVIRIDECTLVRADSSARRIVVVGDSYAASFVRGFDPLWSDDGDAITITSSWGAAPGPGIRALGTQWRASSEDYWRRVVPGLVDSLGPGDILFVIADLAYFVVDGTKAFGSEETALRSLQSSYATLGASVRSRGAELAVLNALPFARDANCSPEIAVPQWYNRLNNACDLPGRAESLERRAPLDSLLRELETAGLITVVDLFDAFCSQEPCEYVRPDGMYLYRDRAHPSNEAARSVAGLIREAFRPHSVADSVPVESSVATSR